MTALFFGWLTFLLTSVAPDPSTLAIMSTSLAHDLGAGLFSAAGLSLLAWQPASEHRSERGANAAL